MKVKLQAEDVFTVIIGKTSLPGMRQVSAWENCIKLQGEDGVLLLFDERGPMARTLDSAFDARPSEWSVIAASPKIREMLNRTDPASVAEDTAAHFAPR